MLLQEGYKERWEGREDEEKDVSNYRMTLRIRGNTVNWGKEALDRTLWGTGFGRGFGSVVRQTTECINVRYSSGLRPHVISQVVTNVSVKPAASMLRTANRASDSSEILIIIYQIIRRHNQDHTIKYINEQQRRETSPRDCIDMR